MINEYIWVTIYLSHLTYSYILRIQVILVSLNEKRKEKGFHFTSHIGRVKQKEGNVGSIKIKAQAY